MSTVNFWSMERFPLVVATDENIIDFYKDEDYTEEESIDCDYDTLNRYYDWISDDFQNDIEAINEKLKVFSVKLKSGYYTGLQFYIDEDDVNLFFKEEANWDDDDVYYTFRVDNKATLKRLIDEEIALINEFLKEEKQTYGLTCLSLQGVFSNGEGVYTETDL